MIKIAHTADIHIRGSARHEEYRKTFELFFDDLRKQKVDYVFIGGDLFHTKTKGITPEYLRFIHWYLMSLAEIAPVFMILGNHDGIFQNEDACDSISPIVEMLNHPRIKLYRESGIYPINDDIDLCVFSIFDTTRWDIVKPTAGKLNIACFHGSVAGSTTDLGWAMHGERTVDDFKDFDLTFLGDIHKQQFLAQRNEKPWIAYPGSLIPQDFSETADKGYLLWNIDPSSKDWTVEFRKIGPVHPYVTLRWTGDIDAFLRQLNIVEPNSRIRIQSNFSISKEDREKIGEKLNALACVESVFDIDTALEQSILKTEMHEKLQRNLQDPDALFELIRSRYPDENFDDEEWQQIHDLIRRYMRSMIWDSPKVESVQWKLKQLKFDNVLAYGENNQINLEKMKGIIGILGPNKLGKSSIIGAIAYALFNASDREPTKSVSYINRKKNQCAATALVDINGHELVIERTTTKKRSGKSVTANTQLNVWKAEEDGTRVNLNKDTRVDTDKLLATSLGTYDDFALTALSVRNDVDRFIKLRSGPRKEVLTRFLNIDFLDKLFDVVKQDLAEIKGSLKSIAEKDWNALIANEEQKLSTTTNGIEALRLEIEECQHVIEAENEKIHRIKAKGFVSSQDIQRWVLAIEHLQNNLETKRAEEARLVENQNELASKVDKLKSILDLVSLEQLQQELNQIVLVEKQVFQLRNQLKQEELVEQQRKRTVLKLNEVPCGDQFPTCKYIRDAHDDKKLLAESARNIENFTKQLTEMTERFTVLQQKGIQEKINKLNKAQATLSTSKIELAQLETKIVACRAILKSDGQKLQDTCKKLEEAKANVNDEITTYQKNVSELKSKLQELEGLRDAAIQRKGYVAATIEKIQREQEQFIRLQKDYRIYDFLSRVFNKKGLPNQILSQYLPAINSVIQKLISGLFNFTIELVVDDSSLEIILDDGAQEQRREIELGSGMEQLVASIALRVALLSVTTLPKPNFMIIDEGFTALDEHQVEPCNKLIQSLKSHFDHVLIITHIDQMKQVIDHHIKIEREDSESRICNAY